MRFNSSRAARLMGWYWKTRAAGGSYGALPNGYRSAVTSMPSSSQMGGRAALENPGLESEYDPREFHLQAVIRKVYESQVSKAFARPFRSDDDKQMRADAIQYSKVRHKDAVADQLRKFQSIAFGHSRNLAKDTGLYARGTEPSVKLAEKSWDRYQGEYLGSDNRIRTLDDLINTRQSYEEMLAIPRKSGFYRITQEPTKKGARWFVWPLAPGQRVPGPAAEFEEDAQEIADRLNRIADPRETGRWHVPDCSYKRRELAHWLPPASAFFPEPAPVAPVVPARRRPRR